MTNSSASEPADEEVLATSETIPNSGETERLIARARGMIGAAAAQGRLDIVEAAGALIDDLVEKHTALAIEHGANLQENAALVEAKAELDSARACLPAADPNI